MQPRMLYLIYFLAFTGVGRVAAFPGLVPSLVAGTTAIAHPRALLQAASAGTVPYINQLQGVMNEIEGQSGRPVTYKNVEAARYIAYADANELVPGEPSRILKVGSNSSVLLAWQNSTGGVIMAFPASSSSASFNATEPGFAPSDVNSFLKGDFAGAYPTAASAQAGSFLALAKGGGRAAPPLTAAVTNITAYAEVRRVVCTGYGNGGALAELCGIWAAVTYPAAQIRTIAYGAPVVGNTEFAFSFQQLVDLSYLWSLSTHLDITNATTGFGPASEVYLLNDKTVAGNATIVPNSFNAYVQAIVEYYRTTSDSAALSNSTGNSGSGFGGGSGGISGAFNDIKNIGSAVVNGISNLGDILDTVKSFVYRGDQAESLDKRATAAALAAKDAATGCPPLLCKMRPAADYSCQVYNNGSNTIAPGSVTIGPVNDTGTQLAVAWNKSSSTATIVFKGSSSRADWLTDFRVALNDANTNTALDQVFPNIEIHSGFLQSFQSVTENAASPAVNITAVLQRLAGGPVSPTRVIVSGHSLGAGVAAIAGPWAALTWPAADVRVATFGAPMPGNAQFAQVVKLLAGTQNRVVHTLDIVPALPPLKNYSATDYGRWISKNATTVLEQRPDFDFNKYNWNDHNCRLYQANMYTTNFTTAPSNLAGALANATATDGAQATAATTAQDSSAADAPNSAPGATGTPTQGAQQLRVLSTATAAACSLLAVACLSLV